MVEDEVKTAKFSSGLNIIMRLDALWKDAHNHSRSGQYERWNYDLDRVWCELARDLKETDYSARKETFDGFDKQLAELGKFNDGGSVGFKDMEKDEIDKRSKQYHVLMEKELFLRRLENELGKGTTWIDDDDSDLD